MTRAITLLIMIFLSHFFQVWMAGWWKHFAHVKSIILIGARMHNRLNVMQHRHGFVSLGDFGLCWPILDLFPLLLVNYEWTSIILQHVIFKNLCRGLKHLVLEWGGFGLLQTKFHKVHKVIIAFFL